MLEGLADDNAVTRALSPGDLTGIEGGRDDVRLRVRGFRVALQADDTVGFHHRLVRVTGRRNSRWSVTFLARWPADRAMKHARDRIRELTRRSRLLLPVEVIVDEVNRFLRGWAAYFRYGNSAIRFEKLMHNVWTRMALVIAKRHRRSRAYGWSLLAYQSPDHLGLISPVRNRCRPQILQGLAGETECRR